MSRAKKKAGRASDVDPAAEVPTPDVPCARVSVARTSPLDGYGGGKEKFLEHVVTPKSKKKPPLPKDRKRKQPPEESQQQVRRSTRRLEATDSNDGVHIHVNLDNSSQVQSRSASPKKITVIVSPGKMRRRTRRSLEVSTPSPLARIQECNGSDEEAAQPQSTTQEGEDGVVEPSVAEDFENTVSDPIENPVLPMHKPQLLVLGTSASRPPSPGACNEFELSVGATPYLVDIASSGDDTRRATGVQRVPTTPNATPPRVRSPTFNIENLNADSGNPESPEEALDRIIATLPTPARLKWLSTRAHNVQVRSNFYLQSFARFSQNSRLCFSHVPLIHSTNARI